MDSHFIQPDRLFISHEKMRLIKVLKNTKLHQTLGFLQPLLDGAGIPATALGAIHKEVFNRHLCLCIDGSKADIKVIHVGSFFYTQQPEIVSAEQCTDQGDEYNKKDCDPFYHLLSSRLVSSSYAGHEFRIPVYICHYLRMTESHIFGFSSVVFYVLASLLVAKRFASQSSFDANTKRLAMGLGIAGVILHAVALHKGMLLDHGLNLSITNIGSLVAWLIASLLVVGSLKHPLESLALIFFPIAALTLLLAELFPDHGQIANHLDIGVQVHVLLSIVAYSLLSIAALQAIVLAYADASMRKKKPLTLIRMLPPLQTMETHLFRLIWVGLLLLTLSLISGFHYVEDMMAQHLMHKTVLSVIAWLVFAVLLFGRHQYGWRGRTAIRFTLVGMGLLLLAFFGSKAVLELILQR